MDVHRSLKSVLDCSGAWSDPRVCRDCWLELCVVLNFRQNPGKLRLENLDTRVHGIKDDRDRTIKVLWMKCEMSVICEGQGLTWLTGVKRMAFSGTQVWLGLRQLDCRLLLPCVCGDHAGRPDWVGYATGPRFRLWLLGHKDDRQLHSVVLAFWRPLHTNTHELT